MLPKHRQGPLYNSVLFGVVLVTIFLSTPCVCAPMIYHIDLARLIATEAVNRIEGQVSNRRDFGIEADQVQPNEAGYFTFRAFLSPDFDRKVPVEATLANLSVDAATGDVWDTTSCKEVRSKEIEILQKKYRRELHLSRSRYSRIRRAGFGCGQQFK